MASNKYFKPTPASLPILGKISCSSCYVIVCMKKDATNGHNDCKTSGTNLEVLKRADDSVRKNIIPKYPHCSVNQRCT
jgi:hypothetical protein